MAQHALLAPVIAHRGASGSSPENTLSALAYAADQGATCAEIDVSISADSVPFVHHDDRLERCTDGTGFLTEHTAAELDQLCASTTWQDFPGEPLPRLTAVIELLSERNMALNLEIKPREGFVEATTVAVCAILQTHWPKKLPLVLSSFNEDALAFARKIAPDIPRALIVGGLPADWQARLQSHAASNLHISARNLTKSHISTVTQAGFGLYAYTVNERERADELFSWGIDGIFTDHPSRMLA